MLVFIMIVIKKISLKLGLPLNNNNYFSFKKYYH